jgi:hypothetical protein
MRSSLTILFGGKSLLLATAKQELGISQEIAGHIYEAIYTDSIPSNTNSSTNNSASTNSAAASVNTPTANIIIEPDTRHASVNMNLAERAGVTGIPWGQFAVKDCVSTKVTGLRSSLGFMTASMKLRMMVTVVSEAPASTARADQDALANSAAKWVNLLAPE